MQRLTISVDDDIAQAFEKLIEARQYKNRSEAFRDLLRREIARDSLERDQSDCVAVVSYAYDHHSRTVSNRMVEHHHDHHHLTISSMHVHVTHDKCVEIAVMRGPYQAVRSLADATIAATGIEEGAVNFISVPHHHDPDHKH